MPYYSDDDPNQDFDTLDGDVAEALAVWRAECKRCREIVAMSPLDETGIEKRTGQPVSLRRIVVHLIAEYARHQWPRRPAPRTDRRCHRALGPASARASTPVTSATMR